ncbi:MAG: META domain-containing protein [Phaeodactylibacter sp.]|nr:META domain-containing protein [Phaeodactylibacter sp.]MCB9293600.1 META domain-containing protein [Lewinellaceae bacterium]
MATSKTILISLSLLLSLTACPREPATDQTLEGTSWVLLKFSLKDGEIQEPQGEKPITLKFKADQASGFAGCNAYFASYKYVAPSGQLHFDGIGATEKYCAGLMEQEKQYLNLLEKAQNYSVRPGQLEVSSPDGKLLFEKESAGVPGQEP